MAKYRIPGMIARLTLRRDHALPRPDDALSWGVPIARGRLRETRSLALRAARAGGWIPVQADVTARWPDGSVKWLLVTSLGIGKLLLRNGTAADSCAVELCEVDAATLPPHAATLRLAHLGPDLLMIDTGELRFELAPTGPIIARFDAHTSQGWRTLATGFDLVTAVERDGKITEYSARAQPRKIEIESVGPLRARIAIRGTHGDAEGNTFGPYVLRLTVTAGSPQIHLTHSLVFDGDPDRDFLRASEVRLAARTGQHPRFAFGGDDGRETRFLRQFAPFFADWRVAQLRQDIATGWRLTRHVEPTLPAVFCDQGVKNDGWAQLAGSDGSVAVAIREFAENSPKALAIDAETGLFTASLHPRHAERLDLRRYSPTIYPMSYEAPSTWKEETYPFPRDFGAWGVRKTHDLLLAFNSENPSADANRFNFPLRLTWPASYTAKTAFIVPAADRVDPRWKREAETFVEFMRASLIRGGATGYVNYFDLPMGFSLVENRWLHEHGGMAYINNEALPCLGLLQAYLLTGSRDALTLALAMARHNADSDSHYLGPYAGNGSRHNVSHWGDADKEPRISQPIDKRLGYFLAGDPASLEVTRLLLNRFLSVGQRDRYANMVAEVPAFLSTLIFASDLGWFSDDAWLVRVADALAASVDEQGRVNSTLRFNAQSRTAAAVEGPTKMNLLMFSCFGGPQIFPELAERYDHQPLRDALVRLGRYHMLPRDARKALEPENGDNVHFNCYLVFRSLDLLGYCYRVTGDESIPRHVEACTRTLAVSIKEANESRYGISDAGKRTVPLENRWPDDDGRFDALVKRYRPVPGTEAGQMFNMAVYLHKLQGAMLLAQAAKRKG